ncbi:MAG: choice-of-anchor A family protein [Myxococcota bacterium]
MHRTLFVLASLGLSTVASAHTTSICTTDNGDGTTDIHVGTYTPGHDGRFSASLVLDGVTYGPYTSWHSAAKTYPGSDQCRHATTSLTTDKWFTVTVSVGAGSHTISTTESSNEFTWWMFGGTAPITMNFGPEDTDGDGVYDFEDDCPTEDPATYYGYDVAADGCISDLVGSACPLASAIRDNDTDFNNMADEWGILAGSDATLSGSSQGALRVFGDGDLYSFNVGSSSLNHYSYAGYGDLYARSGTFAGDVRAATVDADQTVSTSGTTTETAFNGHIASYMQALSTDMSNLNINGDTTVQSWGTVDFKGTHPMMNSFEVSAADFAASTWMTIDVPTGSTAVINVLGTTAEFGPTGVGLTGVTASKVVYNFPDATTLELDGVSVKGQIVAPNADIDLVSGDVTGSISGNVLDGTITQYNAAFDGRSCAVVAAKAAPNCTVTHTVTNAWTGGYNATVTISNSGSAASSWSAGWEFANGESVSSGWGGVWTQTSTVVDIENASWNGVLGAGGSVSIGYTGSGTPDALVGLSATCN